MAMRGALTKPTADGAPHYPRSLEREPHHALVLPLPAEAGRDLAARVQCIPYTSVPPLGYHVTLYGPFTFLPARAGRALLHRALRRAHAFPICLEGVSSFLQPGDNDVYLAVQAGAELLRLHVRLAKALKGRVLARHPLGEAWDGAGYTPHVSLGLHVPDAALEDTLERLRAAKLAYRFQARELWLIVRSPASGWAWTRAETFALA